MLQFINYKGNLRQLVISCLIFVSFILCRGNIWFGTEAEDITQRETKGGVWRYDGKSFKNFGVEEGLGNPSVWCVVIDKAGNVWACTRNTSLYRHSAGSDGSGKSFTSFSE